LRRRIGPGGLRAGYISKLLYRYNRHIALLCIFFAAAIVTSCGGYGVGASGGPLSGGTVYVNHDLSTGNLSQWTHRDFGMGTDAGSNASGAGYLWYHTNVAGRRAVGMTATPTAHASPASDSDSVFLWDPSEAWNYQPYEIWLHTSVMFPSAATIPSSGAAGEQPFQPTTGQWNWFLEFHNDSNPVPSCAKEDANIALDVKTDDPVQPGLVGTQNVRLAARIMGGNDCAPIIEWVNGPPLVRDHWYEMLLHIKWSPSGGIFEWYVDNLNTPYYSNLHIATLFLRPAGYVSPSYTSLTVGNYRMHASWNSTIYLGPLVVGSTGRSVLSFSEWLHRGFNRALGLLAAHPQ
jgi:hypothetical protein